MLTTLGSFRPRSWPQRAFVFATPNMSVSSFQNEETGCKKMNCWKSHIYLWHRVQVGSRVTVQASSTITLKFNAMTSWSVQEGCRHSRSRGAEYKKQAKAGRTSRYRLLQRKSLVATFERGSLSCLLKPSHLCRQFLISAAELLSGPSICLCCHFRSLCWPPCLARMNAVVP